ncbi:hypothetical protein ACFL10_00120 [Patescibacteria group bacterium]
MELSLYLAQLLGVVMVVIGLALLIRLSYYQKAYKALVKDEGLMLLAGMITLVLGVVFVLAHNVWVQSWEVIITILGWGMVVKGVLLLLLPTELGKWTAGLMKGKGLLVFGGLLYLVLGVVLCYFGYFV